MENKKKAHLEVQHRKEMESLREEVQGLLAYLNRPWDLNLKKQNLQLSLNLCSQIHRIWEQMRCLNRLCIPNLLNQHIP